MPHPIVEEFAKYATLTTNSGYEMSAAGHPDIVAAIAIHCTDIQKLIASKPAFFTAFDYGWAAKPENYAHPVEAQLQFGLLLVISEIIPTHADYPRLGNICIRTLPSRHINMEAVVRGPNKYIVVATATIRRMQAWAVTMRHVGDIGRAAPEDTPVICIANFLGGQDLEKAVRTNWPAVTPYLDYLVDTCIAYRLGEVPERTFALAENPDASLLHATQFLFVSEMFFICHELIHVLKHIEAPKERSDDEEVEADHWAASLFIIFQSQLARWYAANGKEHLAAQPTVQAAVYAGPAIFFTVMHTLLFVERLTVASQDDAATKLEVLNREFKLNGARLFAYEKALQRFKLDKQGPIYQAALQQLDVIAVACRMRLIERYALPAQVSLDQNLFRGFPES